MAISLYCSSSAAWPLKHVNTGTKRADPVLDMLQSDVIASKKKEHFMPLPHCGFNIY